MNEKVDVDSVGSNSGQRFVSGIDESTYMELSPIVLMQAAFSMTCIDWE